MTFPPLYAREALVLGLSVYSSHSANASIFHYELVSAFFPSAMRADGMAFRDVLQMVLAGIQEPVPRLEEWARAEDVHQYLALGREFAQLTYELGTVRLNLDFEELDLRALVSAVVIVERIKTNQLVRSTYYLNQAVDYFARFVRGISRQASEDWTQIAGMIDEQVAAFHSRLLILGLGLGELLGNLNDLDDERLQRDAAAVTPRVLWIEPTEDIDVLRGRLLTGERALAAVSDAPGLCPAEYVVSGCVDVIDALVKRLWPATAVDAAGGIRKFLAPKLGQGTPVPVRRFASIVTNLHLSYRNPAAHEAERFRCTLREAKYILCGIHVLIDLHDEIREQKLT